MAGGGARLTGTGGTFFDFDGNGGNSTPTSALQQYQGTAAVNSSLWDWLSGASCPSLVVLEPNGNGGFVQFGTQGVYHAPPCQH